MRGKERKLKRNNTNYERFYELKTFQKRILCSYVKQFTERPNISLFSSELIFCRLFHDSLKPINYKLNQKEI